MKRANRSKILSPELRKRKGLSPEMKSFSESNLREVKSSPEIQRRSSTPDFHHIGEQNGISYDEMNKEKMSSSIFGRMMSSFTKRSSRNLKSSSETSADGQFSHSSLNDEEIKSASGDYSSIETLKEEEESKDSSKESLLLHFAGEPFCKESNTAKVIDEQVDVLPVFSGHFLLPSAAAEDGLLHPSLAVTNELHLIDGSKATDFLEAKKNNGYSLDESAASKEVLLPANLSSSVFLPEMPPSDSEQALDANYTPEEDVDIGLDMENEQEGEACTEIEVEGESLLTSISPTLKEEVNALNPTIKTIEEFSKQIQKAKEDDDEVVYTVDDPTDLNTTATHSPLKTQHVMLSEDQTQVFCMKNHLRVFAYLSVISIALVLLVALLNGRYDSLRSSNPSNSNSNNAVAIQPSKTVISIDIANPYFMPATPPVTEVATMSGVNSRLETESRDKKRVEAKDTIHQPTANSTKDKARNEEQSGSGKYSVKSDIQESVAEEAEEDTTFEALRQRQAFLEEPASHSNQQDQQGQQPRGNVYPPAVIVNKGGKRGNVVMRVLKFPFLVPKLMLEIVNAVLRLLFAPLAAHRKQKKNGGTIAAKKEVGENEQVWSPLPVELI